MSKLDQEEQEILDAYESAKIKRAKHAAQTQQRHREYAEAMWADAWRWQQKNPKGY